MENRQKDDHQELCKAGCGFFGAKHQQGYCSVCFKEKQSRDTNPAPAPASPVLPTDEKIIEKPTMPSSSSNGRKRSYEESNYKSSSATRLPSTDSENQKVTDSMADMNVNPSTSTSSSTVLPIPSASPVKIEAEASPASSSAPDAKLPETDDSAAAPPAKKPKKRCGMCKKKLGLTGFECRCGLLFCGVHRYSDKHDCSFDYKENGRAELSKLNPVCAGEKIQKL
jgi:hypothetical protein